MKRRCAVCRSFLYSKTRLALCARCVIARLHPCQQALPDGSHVCNRHVDCEKRKAWEGGDRGSVL